MTTGGNQQHHYWVGRIKSASHRCLCRMCRGRKPNKGRKSKARK